MDTSTVELAKNTAAQLDELTGAEYPSICRGLPFSLLRTVLESTTMVTRAARE
jgi:hypothetical protein